MSRNGAISALLTDKITQLYEKHPDLDSHLDTDEGVAKLIASLREADFPIYEIGGEELL